MPEPTFLNRKEAAAICGKSEDTLRRYDRLGRLPNRRVGDDGVVVYPTADLVGAGLLNPLAAAGPIAELATRGRAERDLAIARTELAVARARIAELTTWVERTEREITFLRSIVTKSQVA